MGPTAAEAMVAAAALHAATSAAAARDAYARLMAYEESEAGRPLTPAEQAAWWERFLVLDAWVRICPLEAFEATRRAVEWTGAAGEHAACEACRLHPARHFLLVEGAAAATLAHLDGCHGLEVTAAAPRCALVRWPRAPPSPAPQSRAPTACA